MDKEEYKRQNEQRHKRKDAKSFGNRWFGWWKTPSDRFAALIALFTAVLAGVAYFQLSAMRSTDEATHALAEAALKQAKAASDQANAALTALRPYMSYELSLRKVDDFNQAIEPDVVPASALLDVKFTNHGNMAAKIVGVYLSYAVEPSLPIPRLIPELYEGVLPSQTLLLFNKPLSIWPEGFLIELNEKQQGALEEGTKKLWVYGNLVFTNYVHADAKDGPQPWLFARRYRFKSEGRKRPGFTHDDVPIAYYER